MKLFIHTCGRAGRQVTRDRFPDSLRKKTWLVVQDKEKHHYVYPRLMVLPPGIERLSPTRQWILENSDDPHVVLLDDDLAFFEREPAREGAPNTAHSLGTLYDEAVGRPFQEMERFLEQGFLHCGISAREGNNHTDGDTKQIGRMMRCLGYNAPKVLSAGARFDRIDTKQDFDMTLQLLRKGHPNIISFKFAQGQMGGSGAKGGCATYRDEAMMDRCAQELADLHPGFVKVTEKRTKSGAWKGMRQEDGWTIRKDVTISWRKAYESSGKEAPTYADNND